MRPVLRTLYGGHGTHKPHTEKSPGRFRHIAITRRACSPTGCRKPRSLGGSASRRGWFAAAQDLKRKGAEGVRVHGRWVRRPN
jgi:hypothetical protein